jgi:hypothetical protein
MRRVWSYCHAKERNVPPERRGQDGIGDMWIWTDRLGFKLGRIVAPRQTDSGRAKSFISDLAGSIASKRVQVTTDGFGIDAEVIECFLLAPTTGPRRSFTVAPRD